MNRSRSVSVLARLNSNKLFNLRYLAILVVLLVGLPFLAYGQEATIVGTVTDPAGAVVPNVTITITNVAPVRIKYIQTNEAGQYRSACLPIGKYNVKAEAAGFKVEESQGVVLNVNDRTRVDFQMKVGTKSETVSVEANAIQVQADSSEQSSLVSGTQISQLPTNGRSIYSYVTADHRRFQPDARLSGTDARRCEQQHQLQRKPSRPQPLSP